MANNHGLATRVNNFMIILVNKNESFDQKRPSRRIWVRWKLSHRRASWRWAFLTNSILTKLNQDECQIKVTAVSVCGSDINLWKWNDVARTIASLPFIPGHEAVGVVVKCGPEATHKLGQRVAVENHFYCENCVMCDAGRGDICNKMKQYGHGKGTTQVYFLILIPIFDHCFRAAALNFQMWARSTFTRLTLRSATNKPASSSRWVWRTTF